MLYPLEKDYDIGVIVGRFQVHELHKGHRELIDSVLSRHKKVLIVIGNSNLLVTRNNPLDYQTRARMLQDAYSEITVMPIKDEPTDEGWSKNLDFKIRDVFPQGSVVIYGSRDSFIPHYFGKFPTVELDQSINISATEIRNSISMEVRSSPDFRHGVVYAAYNKFPTSYQCTDIAVLKPNISHGSQVILIRKNKDPEDKWRFPGGFVDPTDKTLEQAARRELNEEVGILEVSGITYVGSYRVPDWRYRKEVDKIMTTLFVADYNYGSLQAGDDADHVDWFNVSEDIFDMIVDEHKPLMEGLFSYLEKEKKL